MSEIIDFPRKKRLKTEEINNIVKLVQDAINTHEVLREHAERIKSDKRLDSVSNEVILKSLTILLKSPDPN